MTKEWIIGIVVVVGLIWWWQSRNLIQSEDGINTVPTGDRDMERAINQARENYPHFVDRLHNPQPGDENFAIKAGITHEGNIEHIWLGDVSADEQGFSGTIGNDPRHIPFKIGDAWRGDLSQLSDWMYFSNGRMQGNFTLRAMLPRMPKRQREQARLMLDSTWDTRALAHLPWPRDAAMPGAPLPDDISGGDSALMEGVSDHLEKHLGKIPSVFHEIISPSAHIDLCPYPATRDRPFHIIATTGMAEKPMQLPENSGGDQWAELVLMLPVSWPLDKKSWNDERHFWPLRWIKRVARFHYETGHWLGEGHLLTHGDPSSPAHESVAYDSVLLAKPMKLPPGFARVTLKDGRNVRLLCLYFLDAATREDLTAKGWDDFDKTKLADRLSL